MAFSGPEVIDQEKRLQGVGTRELYVIEKPRAGCLLRSGEKKVCNGK